MQQSYHHWVTYVIGLWAEGGTPSHADLVASRHSETFHRSVTSAVGDSGDLDLSSCSAVCHTRNIKKET